MRVVLLLMAICFSPLPVLAALNRNQIIDREMSADDPSAQDPPPAQGQAEQISQPYVWGTETGVAEEKQYLGRRKTHTFDLGVDPYYNRYNERSLGVYNIGTMLGYYANYTYRPQNNILDNPALNTYRLEGHYAKGKLNYKGSGLDKGRTNTMVELRALVGKEMLSDAYSCHFTPYLGFGYRFLFDRGQGRLSSDGHVGYNRKSHYFYLPVGMTLDVPTSKNSETSFNMEFDYFLQGYQKSYLSDGNLFLAKPSNDVSNHQKRGFGLRGSVRFLKHLYPVDVYAEPFIRYWNIRDSKIVNSLVTGANASVQEPHNTTIEAGSKFGVQF